MKFVIAMLVATAVPAAALAQPVSGADRRDAADPGAPVAPMAYQSPFAGYRPFAAGSAAPWRAVNDEVGRIGGWKAYAREAYEAASAPVPAPQRSEAPPVPPRPDDPGPGKK